MTNVEWITKINNDGKPVTILVDFSSIFIRTSFSCIEELQKTAFEEWEWIKALIIDNLLTFKKAFKQSQLVLCFDTKVDGKYWRHDVYSNYKKTRKEQLSSIPKDILFKENMLFRQELQEYFSWKLIDITGIEADDSIGVLSQYLNEHSIIIYSPDKDFKQLQKYENVYIYDTMKSMFIIEENPTRFLFMQILKGDTADCIPNYMSEEDVLITPGKRQPSIRETKITEMYEVFNSNIQEFKQKYLTTPLYEKRFIQNRKLVDLAFIPNNIKNDIISCYNNCKPKGNFNTFLEFCKKYDLEELSMKIY
jgi:5'-3' exonuclease